MKASTTVAVFAALAAVGTTLAIPVSSEHALEAREPQNAAVTADENRVLKDEVALDKAELNYDKFRLKQDSKPKKPKTPGNRKPTPKTKKPYTKAPVNRKAAPKTNKKPRSVFEDDFELVAREPQNAAVTADENRVLKDEVALDKAELNYDKFRLKQDSKPKKPKTPGNRKPTPKTKKPYTKTPVNRKPMKTNKKPRSVFEDDFELVAREPKNLKGSVTADENRVLKDEIALDKATLKYDDFRLKQDKKPKPKAHHKPKTPVKPPSLAHRLPHTLAKKPLKKAPRAVFDYEMEDLD